MKVAGSIPALGVVDIRICSKCKLGLNIEEFAWKVKGLRYQSTCKNCSRLRSRDHYLNNKGQYKQNRLRAKDRIRQAILNHYLSHPCVDCGESDPVVLQFDHVRGIKEFEIGHAIDHHSVEVMMDEIAKCEVRCANCHLRKTAKDQKWYKYRCS